MRPNLRPNVEVPVGTSTLIIRTVEDLKDRLLMSRSSKYFGGIVDPLSGTDKARFSNHEIVDLSSKWSRVFRRYNASLNTPILIPMRISIHSIGALLGALDAGFFPILVKPSTPINLMIEALSQASGGYVLVPERAKQSYLKRGLQDCGNAEEEYVVLKTCAEITPHVYPYPILGILSSGSTGRPKVIVQSLSNVVRNAEMHIDAIGLQPNDTIGLNLPFYYSYGLVAGLFGTLLSGANGILADSLRVNTQRVFSEFNLTVGMTTPGSAQDTFGADVLGSLRILTVGGDILHLKQAQQLIQDVQKGQVAATYGLSEAGPRVATSFLSADVLKQFQAVPLGTALHQVKLSLDTVENDDSQGELLVETPTAMLEYLNEPLLTNEAFSKDRSSIRTGDIFKKIDGELFFMGRKKRLIIRAGENLYPAFIEAQILRHCDVDDVWVTEENNDALGQSARAYVVAKNMIDFAKVSKELRRHMPASQIPSSWVQVQNLPPQARK